MRVPYAIARFSRGYRTLLAEYTCSYRGHTQRTHHDRVAAPCVRPWFLIDVQLPTWLTYNGAALLQVSTRRHEVGTP